MMLRFLSHNGVAAALTLVTVASAFPLEAQFATGRLAKADSMREACGRSARKKDKTAATSSAKAANALYDSLARDQPSDPDPLVGRARVISECELPFASWLRAPGLAGRSADILKKALALDSTHWGARYSLALNYYHTPEFAGRTGDAIREFERLLQQQGDATLFPELARPYGYLGDLYLRENRAQDAERVWRRGAGLFPNDEGLRRRLDRLPQRKSGAVR